MNELRAAVRAAIRGRDLHKDAPCYAAAAERVALGATQKFLDAFMTGTPLKDAQEYFDLLSDNEFDAMAFMFSNSLAGRPTPLDRIRFPEASKAEASVIDAAVAKLPALHRCALRMYSGERLTAKQVGDRLRMSEEDARELIAQAFTDVRMAMIEAGFR